MNKIKKRNLFTESFKNEVVRCALNLPYKSRIKPVCKKYRLEYHINIEPVQLRKWIKKYIANSLLSLLGHFGFYKLIKR